MWLSRHGLDLNTAAGYQKTADAIRALSGTPAVIVVDTLHRHLLGDENSATDAKTMLDACGALIQEFSCTVILVHHTGVSAEAQHRARGSSAWKGALDIEISVVPGDVIEVVQRKSKDAELADPIFAALARVQIAGWLDEDGETVSSAVLEPADAPEEPSKSDNKLQKMMKDFRACWWHSGANLCNNSPFVSRDDVVNFYVDSRGLSQVSAKNYAKPSVDTKLIGFLVQAGVIEASGTGWYLVDNVQKSLLLLEKNGTGTSGTEAVS